ncbi:MAG: phosphoribosyltransferase family protein [Acidimicrobiia bacterium]
MVFRGNEDRMFRDRREAGRELALRLESLRAADTVVLALPRGGVPVGFEVAAALDSPLDVIVVRKLGVPTQPELAMGAIGENGVRVLDEDLMARAGVRPGDLEAVEREERAELERRVRRYRGDRSAVSLRGKVALVVDDGIATGSTARAAARAARAAGASSVVVAAPVGPVDARERLATDADEVVIACTPDPFHAIGAFYADFSQTTDSEVRRLLGVDER